MKTLVDGDACPAIGPPDLAGHTLGLLGAVRAGFVHDPGGLCGVDRGSPADRDPPARVQRVRAEDAPHRRPHHEMCNLNGYFFRDVELPREGRTGVTGYLAPREP
jgi:hypothetical protein